MNDNIKMLLELINENPELPVICMVDSDVVAEDYGRWMAQIERCTIGEYALYNERYYDDREAFKEDYYDHNDEYIDEMFGYNPRWSIAPDNKEEVEARIDKYFDEVTDRAFKKAIIVYIDTPDDVEEFSGVEQ